LGTLPPYSQMRSSVLVFWGSWLRATGATGAATDQEMLNVLTANPIAAKWISPRRSAPHACGSVRVRWCAQRGWDGCHSLLPRSTCALPQPGQGSRRSVALNGSRTALEFRKRKGGALGEIGRRENRGEACRA